MSERKIEVAYIVEDGIERRINVSELFGKREGFNLRESFSRDGVSFKCIECGEDLTISYLKSTVYLKHFPNSPKCILKDESSQLLVEEINRINYAKESDLHKSIKQKIIEKLRGFAGVSNVLSEDYIIDKYGKRRPDVYCEYNSKRIVFEVQLSMLSLRYINYRYDFYWQQGIYLVWVRDRFFTQNQNSLDRDLKYRNAYQNVFEISNDRSFLLTCNYKEPKLNGTKVYSKWKKKKINLNDLSFDDQLLQVYYFDYPFSRDEVRRKASELRREEEVRENNRRVEQYRLREKKENLDKQIMEVDSKLNSISRKERLNKNEIDDNKNKIQRISDSLLRPIDDIETMFNPLKRYSFFDFLNSSELVKNLFDEGIGIRSRIDELDLELNKCNAKIRGIDGLEEVVVYGNKYKLLDRRKHERVIRDNYKRIVLVHEMTLRTESKRLVKQKDRPSIDSLLRSDDYAILLTMSTKLQKLASQINALTDEVKSETGKIKEIKQNLIRYYEDYLVQKRTTLHAEIYEKERELKVNQEEKEAVRTELDNLLKERNELSD